MIKKGTKLSKEHREKIRLSHLGLKPSRETIEKRIKTMKEMGRYNFTEEHRRKISHANLGRKHSEETKRKISEIQKGKKKKPMLEETKKKIGLSNSISLKGNKQSKKTILKRIESRKGYKHSEKTKQKIRESNKGHYVSKETRKKISKSNIGKKSGKDNYNWNGGITPVKKLIRECFKYKQWRADVFKRDNWTCQTCKKRGCVLNAHHIKEFAKILKDNQIISLKLALKCKELWEVDNGVTLCEDCHSLTKKGRNKNE